MVGSVAHDERLLADFDAAHALSRDAPVRVATGRQRRRAARRRRSHRLMLLLLPRLLLLLLLLQLQQLLLLLTPTRGLDAGSPASGRSALRRRLRRLGPAVRPTL